MEINEVIGKLKLLSKKEPKKRRKGIFLCSCGKSFEAVIGNVMSGNTKSCGCSKITHAQTGTKTYKAWACAKNRCFNPKVKAFKTHGARGITMCKEWVVSFEAFLADMGNAPENTSLDRIDNNGDYAPGNCRWANIYEQNRNTRVACIWFVDGKEYESLRDAAQSLGVGIATIGNWVNGRIRDGKHYPPKENCYKVNRCPDPIQQQS